MPTTTSKTTVALMPDFLRNLSIVAEEDMSLAEYIFKGGHWLYTAFMCHQAIVMIPMNIEARYPDYKRNVANSLNEKAAKDILDKTKQLLKWIRQQFPETKTNKTES